MINQSYVLARRKPFNERFGMFLWPYDRSGYNAVFFKKQLDAALDLGVGLISIASRPDNANDDVGTIDGAFDMAQAAGMTVRTTLGAGAALNGGAVDYPNHIHDMDDWNKRYIQHLAGRGLIWDSSNEANNPGFWYGKSSYYDHSLIKDWLSVDKVLYNYVRQYDPGSIFLNGDLYRGPYDLQKGQWADEWDVMVQDGLMSFGEAVSVHPYLEDSKTGYPHSPESLLQYMATPDNATLPLVVTEFSYNRSTMDVNKQANWLARAWFIFDYMQVPFVLHYGFWDEYQDDNGGYAIFDHDWNAYPAATSLKYWLHELKGYYFNQRISVGNDGADFVFDYVEDTEHKLIGWTSGADHQVTVNGHTYTITNSPQLLSTYTAPIKLVTVDSIWHLKDVLNTNFSQIAQFTTTCLTKLKKVYPDLDVSANVDQITATTLGREFRLQVIQGSQQSVELLERVATVIRKIGHQLQLVNVPIPRTLMLRKEDYNSMIAALTKNINLIEQFV